MIVYLITINAIGVLLMLIDKAKAKKKRYRIPERILFGTAIIGGGPGIYAGMYLFRHKTLHKSFSIGIPLIMAIQFILLFLLYTKTSIRLF